MSLSTYNSGLTSSGSNGGFGFSKESCLQYQEDGSWTARSNQQRLGFSCAILQREGVAPELVAVLDEIIQQISAGNGVYFQHAMVKSDDYLSRLFSSESWRDWLDNRTELGKVMAAFRNCLHAPGHKPSRYLEPISTDILKRAADQAKIALRATDVSVDWKQKTLDLLASPFVAFHQATQFPAVNGENWLEKQRKSVEGFARDPVGTTQTVVVKAGKDTGNTLVKVVDDTLDTAVKAVEATGDVLEKAGKELGKGAKTVWKHGVAGAEKYVEHHIAAARSLYKLATREHKLNPKSFDEVRRKARDDWSDEMERAPEPVKLVHNTVKAMVEGDPERTLVFVASLVVDAYAPGVGEYIRQGYNVYKMIDAGQSPEKIVQAIVEGNADEILRTVASAYVPGSGETVEGVLKAKAAYEKYEKNKETIEKAFKGDMKSLGLLAQTIAVMDEDVSKKFEEIGVSADIFIGLQANDPAAARALLSAGLKASVDSAIGNKKASSERVRLSEEEDFVVREDGSTIRASEEFKGKKSPHTPGEAEHQKLGEKLSDRALNHAVDEGLEKGSKRAAEKANKKLRGAGKAWKKKKIQTEKEKLRKQGTSKRQVNKKTDAIKKKAYHQSVKATKSVRKLINVAKKLGAKANTIRQLLEAPEETILEYVLTKAAKMSKVLRPFASGIGGGLTELIISEDLSKGDQLEGEALCKSLGFKSCADSEAWTVKK